MTTDAPPSTRSAPPVLLVHGTFSHGELMAPWTRRLQAAGFACHAPSLPGRLPTDHAALRRLGFRDLLESLLESRARLDEPPIVIGHSMGGLLGQHLAARTPCAALVLLASVPPGVLWAQPRAVPHLARLLPRTLTARPVLPSEATLRAVVFNDLTDEEGRALAPTLVADSGRAFRSLLLGTARVPGGALTCPVLCVSGGADRNVSARISRSVARRYGAEHHIHPDRGHWMVAESVADELVPPVIEWLHRTGVASTTHLHHPPPPPRPHGGLST